jgi:hypothetical protein
MRGCAIARSRSAPASIALFYLVSVELVNAEALSRFLKARLSSEQTKEDWRKLLEGGWERLLDTPLSTFLGEEVDRAVEAHLGKEQILGVVRPAIRLWLAKTIEHAREDDRPLERWVPPEAKAKLLELAARKDSIDPRWVEHLFAQKAMEDVITDTLYRALRDFSTIVPRMVASLTPSIIGKISNKITNEVEKRLEPEIKKFLDLGGRKALDGAARFTKDHLDDPVSIEARKNTILFALQQSPAFHVSRVDEQTIALLDEIAEAIALRVAESADARTIAKQVVDRVRLKHGADPVRAWLRTVGVESAPPFEEWAAVSWPYLQTIVGSPACEAFLDKLAAEAMAATATD